MKKIKFNILAAGALCLSLGTVACTEEFLDVESKTESTTGNFYKTERDAYRALLGCYDGYRRSTCGGAVNFLVNAEVMGYECFGGSGASDGNGMRVTDRFDLNELPSSTGSSWSGYYTGIYKCNELISRENDIQWEETNSMRNQYMAECRAIRAFLYFDVVRQFGNIPLITVPTNDNVPQSDPAEVYKLIFEDLKFAIENIPANAYPKAESETNDGKITKYACEAILARAYLYYTGYYGEEPEGVTKADALAAVEDIISSNEYDLVPEYRRLWPAACAGIAEVGDMTTLYGDYAGDGNCETVLTVKCTASVNWAGSDGNRWQVNIAMRTSTGVAPYAQGWGYSTVNPAFVEEYEPGDTRRTASVIDMKGEGLEDNVLVQTCINQSQEYTGYYIKKYAPLAFADGTHAGLENGTGNLMISNHQDYVQVRYADVLLMAAELGSPNAQEYFDKVRKRAFTLPDGTAPDYTPKTASLENILRERQFEFAFEGINYYDLLRQGIDYAAAQLAKQDGVEVLTAGAPTTISFNPQNFIDKKGLMMINTNQIRLSNNVLKQNPGWE